MGKILNFIPPIFTSFKSLRPLGAELMLEKIGAMLAIKGGLSSGNLLDKFYSTGTIVEVTPYIYNEDGTNYVLLQLQVERSSADPGEITTEIRKTVANTEVLMLDGEETIVAGLFTHEEITTRSGIPFLKDLPWWVFGIRYLTGSNKTQMIKREIIILIKMDIVPTLKERIARKKEDVIKRAILENTNYLENIKGQQKEAHSEINEANFKKESFEEK